MPGAHRILSISMATLFVILASAVPAPAKVPADFFGVSAVRPNATDFWAMRATGIRTVRVEVNWRLVQQRRGGGFNWGPTDVRFIHAESNGLRPLPVIYGTPEFIERDPSKVKPPVRSRRNRTAWQEFVAAAIARYGPEGSFWRAYPGDRDASLAPRRWILWNEQNARPFLRPKVSPREYAALARISRRAVRAVDRRVRLIAGGMYGYPGHKSSMGAARFLRRLYRHGGVKQALAGVSLHPYAAGIRGVRRQVRRTRTIMNRAGHRRGAIVIGEIGWASGGPKRSFLVKGPRRQAKLLVAANRLFMRKRRQWRIRHSLWFVWRNYTGDAKGCTWCPKAGLLRADYSAKPAWHAYHDLIRRHAAR